MQVSISILKTFLLELRYLILILYYEIYIKIYCILEKMKNIMY